MGENERTRGGEGGMHRIEFGTHSYDKHLEDQNPWRSPPAREASPEAFPRRSVKNEVRDNLMRKLAAGETLVSRHHRLRRDGHPAAWSTRSCRGTTLFFWAFAASQEPDPSRAGSLLDEYLPVVAGL
jgi:hypothetical protein